MLGFYVPRFYSFGSEGSGQFVFDIYCFAVSMAFVYWISRLLLFRKPDTISNALGSFGAAFISFSMISIFSMLQYIEFLENFSVIFVIISSSFSMGLFWIGGIFVTELIVDNEDILLSKLRISDLIFPFNKWPLSKMYGYPLWPFIFALVSVFISIVLYFSPLGRSFPFLHIDDYTISLLLYNIPGIIFSVFVGIYLIMAFRKLYLSVGYRISHVYYFAYPMFLLIMVRFFQLTDVHKRNNFFINSIVLVSIVVWGIGITKVCSIITKGRILKKLNKIKHIKDSSQIGVHTRYRKEKFRP